MRMCTYMTSSTPQGCNGVLLNFSKPETRAKKKDLLDAVQHRIETTEIQIRSFSFRKYPQLDTEINIYALQLFKLSTSSTDGSNTNQFPQSEMQANSLSCCCGIPCSPVSNIQSWSWFPVFCIRSLHITSVSLDGFDNDVIHCKKNSKASLVSRQQMALREVFCICCWHQLYL